MFEDRKYLIINVSEISLVNFDEILQKSPEYLIYSLDKTKTIIKWDGENPSFVSQLTTGEGPYTNQEILEILKTSDWTNPNPIAP